MPEKKTAAERKVEAELGSYYLIRDLSVAFAKVYRHQDDERHIVVDSRTKKILKRFKDGELAWNKAERFARDYWDEHRSEDTGENY